MRVEGPGAIHHVVFRGDGRQGVCGLKMKQTMVIGLPIAWEKTDDSR
jgi:hypothetical protein